MNDSYATPLAVWLGVEAIQIPPLVERISFRVHRRIAERAHERLHDLLLLPSLRPAAVKDEVHPDSGGHDVAAVVAELDVVVLLPDDGVPGHLLRGCYVSAAPKVFQGSYSLGCDCVGRGILSCVSDSGRL